LSRLSTKLSLEELESKKQQQQQKEFDLNQLGKMLSSKFFGLNNNSNNNNRVLNVASNGATTVSQQPQSLRLDSTEIDVSKSKSSVDLSFNEISSSTSYVPRLSSLNRQYTNRHEKINDAKNYINSKNSKTNFLFI
jgi:hypothetical protein